MSLNRRAKAQSPPSIARNDPNPRSALFMHNSVIAPAIPRSLPKRLPGKLQHDPRLVATRTNEDVFNTRLEQGIARTVKDRATKPPQSHDLPDPRGQLAAAISGVDLCD